MRKVVRLTETELVRLVNRVIKEQTKNPINLSTGTYKFPIDVFLSDDKKVDTKKIKIPKGTILDVDKEGERTLSGQVGGMKIFISGDDNAELRCENFAIIIEINGRDYYLLWAKPIFGGVYNKDYQKIGNEIQKLLGNTCDKGDKSEYFN